MSEWTLKTAEGGEVSVFVYDGEITLAVSTSEDGASQSLSAAETREVALALLGIAGGDALARAIEKAVVDERKRCAEVCRARATEQAAEAARRAAYSAIVDGMRSELDRPGLSKLLWGLDELVFASRQAGALVAQAEERKRCAEVCRARATAEAEDCAEAIDLELGDFVELEVPS